MGKKVISFSMYGNDPKYTWGGVENVYLQKEYYPDWVCRFYVDKSVPKNVVRKLLNLGAEIVFKKSLYKDQRRAIWRYDCFKDRSLDKFIVRDADSRINPREEHAVKEWIDSGKCFHIIRDHKCHGRHIMGGLLGANYSFIDKVADQYDNMIEGHYNSVDHINTKDNKRGSYYDSCELFLKNFIWPIIKNDHIAHIRNLPNLKFNGKERLLKIVLPNDKFCGEIEPYTGTHSIISFL